MFGNAHTGIRNINADEKFIYYDINRNAAGGCVFDSVINYIAQSFERPFGIKQCCGRSFGVFNV